MGSRHKLRLRAVTGPAFYNEHDPVAAEWLRRLIADGAICPGIVSEADIRDLRPADLDGFAQCHFFAGVGIWSLALRMAGVPDHFPVWTGSCPCQPFSQGGAGGGFADERHLWPSWHWLIQQHRPSVILGEQVESPLGRAWLDIVSADMEGLGAAIGTADMPSAGFGAPNIRQRFFWGASQRVAHAYGHGCGPARERLPMGGEQDTEHRCGPRRLGIPHRPGLSHAESPELRGARRRGEGRAAEQSGCPPDPWGEPEWLACLDGRSRPTQPGLFPLAPRHPGDVGRLRAYGNAINPYPAAAFVTAFMEAIG